MTTVAAMFQCLQSKNARWLLVAGALVGVVWAIEACGRSHDDRTKILCFGDSITWDRRFDFQRWTSRLEGLLDDWRPASYRVLNFGFNGCSSSQAVDWLPKRILPEMPAIVLVQFGYNDANVRPGVTYPRVSVSEYRRNLRVIHDTIRAYGGTCIFIINHEIEGATLPQGNGRSYAENYEPYHRALLSVVEELRAPRIDIPAQMAEEQVDPATFLGKDRLHLSKEGSRTYAALVFRGLTEILERASEVPPSRR